MKKNVYGNIEDIVLTIRIVTPIGTWEKPCNAPRMSTGPDINNLIFGHEGLFGIITQVTIKVKALPEVKVYDSIIFPSYEIGAQFMVECGIKRIRPASIRLVDNEQFVFGMALKPAENSKFKFFIDSVKKYYILHVKKFDPTKICACTLVFEGSKEHTDMQIKQIMTIAKKYKGLRGGAENGRRGYALTFTIAYIRDFAMKYYLYAESFEAAVPYEKLTLFLNRVPVKFIQKAIEEAYYSRGLNLKPYMTSRITQLYDTGCCIYFYFGFFGKDVKDPIKIYTEIEDFAREEILNCGGTLSHHHGIGKLRKSFMNRAVGEPALAMLRGLQKTIDPNRIMANSNLIQSIVR